MGQKEGIIILTVMKAMDVNVIDDVIEKVESDIMPMVQDIAQKGQRYIPRR